MRDAELTLSALGTILEMGNLAPILSQNIKFFPIKGMRIESRNETPWASTDFVFRHLVFV